MDILVTCLLKVYRKNVLLFTFFYYFLTFFFITEQTSKHYLYTNMNIDYRHDKLKNNITIEWLKGCAQKKLPKNSRVDESFDVSFIR